MRFASLLIANKAELSCAVTQFPESFNSIQSQCDWVQVEIVGKRDADALRQERQQDEQATSGKSFSQLLGRICQVKRT